MLNPFDLRGPAFLLFYTVFGIAVNLVLRALVLSKEKTGYPSRWDYTDPYKIAYLRAGVFEVIRVTLFSLIDRGLLKASEDRVAAEPDALTLVRRPVEQAVVRFFSGPREVKEIFSDSAIKNTGDIYKRSLVAEGLMSDKPILISRMPMALAALGILLGVSGIKIIVAIMRGRHNIGFLIVLTIVFSIWTAATWLRKRTGAGDEVLRQLGLRFHTLKLRAGGIRPGGMTNDAAYLAAVFGLAVLPETYFPYIKTLFRKEAVSSSGSYSGGCGSGCGGGGGGCGGGGCGGGGCGGCGS